jgi:hypothetical protein
METYLYFIRVPMGGVEEWHFPLDEVVKCLKGKIREALA